MFRRQGVYFKHSASVQKYGWEDITLIPEEPFIEEHSCKFVWLVIQDSKHDILGEIKLTRANTAAIYNEWRLHQNEKEES